MQGKFEMLKSERSERSEKSERSERSGRSEIRYLRDQMAGITYIWDHIDFCDRRIDRKTFAILESLSLSL